MLILHSFQAWRDKQGDKYIIPLISVNLCDMRYDEIIFPQLSRTLGQMYRPKMSTYLSINKQIFTNIQRNTTTNFMFLCTSHATSFDIKHVIGLFDFDIKSLIRKDNTFT